MISTERSIAMLNHSRRVLTPGASRKRKERDGPLDTLKASTTTSTKAEPDPAPVLARSSSNRLLAGYLAHEFLTQGTLFGQKWDPAPAKSASAPVTTTDRAETKKVANGGAEPTVKETAAHQSYAAMANLMKADGTHIPGIVNPTQLARWIQM